MASPKRAKTSMQCARCHGAYETHLEFVAIHRKLDVAECQHIPSPLEASFPRPELVELLSKSFGGNVDMAKIVVAFCEPVHRVQTLDAPHNTHKSGNPGTAINVIRSRCVDLARLVFLDFNGVVGLVPTIWDFPFGAFLERSVEIPRLESTCSMLGQIASSHPILLGRERNSKHMSVMTGDGKGYQKSKTVVFHHSIACILPMGPKSGFVVYDPDMCADAKEFQVAYFEVNDDGTVHQSPPVTVVEFQYGPSNSHQIAAHDASSICVIAGNNAATSRVRIIHKNKEFTWSAPRKHVIQKVYAIPLGDGDMGASGGLFAIVWVANDTSTKRIDIRRADGSLVAFHTQSARVCHMVSTKDYLVCASDANNSSVVVFARENGWRTAQKVRVPCIGFSGDIAMMGQSTLVVGTEKGTVIAVDVCKLRIRRWAKKGCSELSKMKKEQQIHPYRWSTNLVGPTPGTATSFQLTLRVAGEWLFVVDNLRAQVWAIWSP